MQNTRTITGADDIPKLGDVVVVSEHARLAQKFVPGSVNIITRCQMIQPDRGTNHWYKVGALDLEGKEYVQIIDLNELIKHIRVVV